MEKDFDSWLLLKKNIHANRPSLLVNSGGIWWCSVGVNIGAEIDGKNEDFERPVIIVMVYNKETVAVLPVAKKPKKDIFHHKVSISGESRWVKLTQTRVISSKRLTRKIAALSDTSLRDLIIAWKNML